MYTSDDNKASKRRNKLLFLAAAILLIAIPILVTCLARYALEISPFSALSEILFGFSMDGVLSFLGVTGSVLVAIWQIQSHQNEEAEKRENLNKKR